MDHGKRKAKAKVDKPLAERKRRARINDALLQLKSIVLQSINNESTMMSKLEKADILEMTVEYIHKMQHFQSTSSANSQLMSGNNVIVFDGLQYTSGFNECTSHVAECISALPDTDVPDDSIKTRLLEHLVSVASTDDFRNKSKRQDIDPGIDERNQNVEANSIGTNEMCNVETNTYAYSNAMLQNNVCNMEHSLNTKNVTETSCTGYLAPQSEILNSFSDGDASYTVLGNVINNNQNYHYPMYTALHDGLFSIHGEANKVHESLPKEVDNPAFILWPIVQRTEKNEAVGALSVQESKEENDIYSQINVSQSVVSNTRGGEIPCAIESSVSNVPCVENEPKSTLQTQLSHERFDKSDAYIIQISERHSTDGQDLHSPMQNIENSDMDHEPNENGTNAKRVDGFVNTVKDSSIMNIPKKRRVLGDFTNIGPPKKPINTFEELKSEKSLKQPQGKSPKKSKKTSPVKETGRIPKPIKKRITASVFERENISRDTEYLNKNANRLSVHTEDQNVSYIVTSNTIKGHRELRPSGDCSQEVNESDTSSQGNFDGLNVFRSGDSQTENHFHEERENMNNLYSRNANKLPSIDTFHELISGKHHNRHSSPNNSRNVFPRIDQSINNDFYQHYFAQNRSENVWRPW